jgi:hypothetical protein
MINFNYENDFSLSNEEEIVTYCQPLFYLRIKKEGEINYIFLMMSIHTKLM